MSDAADDFGEKGLDRKWAKARHEVGECGADCPYCGIADALTKMDLREALTLGLDDVEDE